MQDAALIHHKRYVLRLQVARHNTWQNRIGFIAQSFKISPTF